MKIRHVLLAAVLATTSVFLTAAPASAADSPLKPFALPAHECATDLDGRPLDGVWCLYIEKRSDNTFLVELGIDIHMSRSDAQAIIDAPGDPFTASMYGSDPLFDNFLFDVPLINLKATDIGLSATFQRIVSRSALDEDDDDRDEVYGKIRFTDPRTGVGRTFVTPQIRENF